MKPTKKDIQDAIMRLHDRYLEMYQKAFEHMGEEIMKMLECSEEKKPAWEEEFKSKISDRFIDDNEFSNALKIFIRQKFKEIFIDCCNECVGCGDNEDIKKRWGIE